MTIWTVLSLIGLGVLIGYSIRLGPAVKRVNDDNEARKAFNERMAREQSGRDA